MMRCARMGSLRAWARREDAVLSVKLPPRPGGELGVLRAGLKA